MISKLKEIIKRYRFKKKLKRFFDNFNIEKSTILLKSFDFDLRKPDKDKIYLKIGKNSVLDCKCIFEKETGKIEIGDRVHIGGGTNLISISKIEIGNDVTIAWDCTIYDHNSHSVYWEERKNDTMQEMEDYKKTGNMIKNKNWDIVKTKPIIIKNKVWIGFGVTILKGVTIGEGAVVAAKSVITKDIPPYSMVGGNPAKILKKIEK